MPLSSWTPRTSSTSSWVSRTSGFFVEPPIGAERPRLPETAPTSSLGSGFTLTWTFGGQDEVVQELYPYATGGPLVHTEPGQLFSETPRAEVRGGWFRADPQLVTDLEQPVAMPATLRWNRSDTSRTSSHRPAWC